LIAEHTRAEARARQLLFIYGTKSPEFVAADKTAQMLRARMQAAQAKPDL